MVLDMVTGGGVQTSKLSAEDWPLIQPSQVNIAVPPVHTAESMLTPLGIHTFCTMLFLSNMHCTDTENIFFATKVAAITLHIWI